MDLLSGKQSDLLVLLQKRFEKHMNRHQSLEWADIQIRLEKSPQKLKSLYEMEQTGGEPDVIGLDKRTGEYIFNDCAVESPKGRRSLCYDRIALESRKENRPENSVLDMASAMGVNLLTEDEYRALQKLFEFDTKTSSWIMTPPEVRDLGGAIFADFRYGKVFVYHNGAESYYSSRGFRGSLRV